MVKRFGVLSRLLTPSNPETFCSTIVPDTGARSSISELGCAGSPPRIRTCCSVFYCGTVGAEFMHITDPARRRWIQERLEGLKPAVDQQRALDLLIRADLFEQVLQQRYFGNKRFSLEGVTALIPLVDEILDAAGQQGAVELVMGMSHRGRLNVIVHVARRAAEEVFAGFEDVDPRSVLGSGDVKYHMGATGEYLTRSGAKVHIHLVSNPSHLEAVDPVTIGRTRAKHDRTGEPGPRNICPCWCMATQLSPDRASLPRL